MGTCLTIADFSGTHDCNINCFKKYNTLNELSSLLQPYNLDIFTDIIMSYLSPLSDYPLQNINPTSNDCIYIHSHIAASNKSICAKWKHQMLDRDKVGLLNLTMAFVGKPGVGRTCLVNRMTQDVWIEDYDPCVGDSYQVIKTYDNDFTVFYDISWPREYDQHEWRWASDHCYWMERFVMLCFDLGDKDSFNHVCKMKDRICEQKKESGDSDYGMMLVITKCDEQLGENNERTMAVEEALDYANQWSLPLVQTSAKCNINVECLWRICLTEYWIQSQTHCSHLLF